MTGRIGKDERNPSSPRQDVPLIISLVESVHVRVSVCVDPSAIAARALKVDDLQMPEGSGRPVVMRHGTSNS